jgi:hypothetical protein
MYRMKKECLFSKKRKSVSSIFFDIILKFFEFVVSRCFLQVIARDLNYGCDKLPEQIKSRFGSAS